jgi:hypothetical protein
VAITYLLFISYFQICYMLGIVPLGMETQFPLNTFIRCLFSWAGLCFLLDIGENICCSNIYFRFNHKAESS